jgi:hypothetical protein
MKAHIFTKKTLLIFLILTLIFLSFYFFKYTINYKIKSLMRLNSEIIKTVDPSINKEEQMKLMEKRYPHFRETLECENYMHLVTSKENSTKFCKTFIYNYPYYIENDDPNRHEFNRFKYIVNLYVFSNEEATRTLFKSFIKAFSNSPRNITIENKIIKNYEIVYMPSMEINKVGEPEYHHVILVLHNKKLIEVIVVNKESRMYNLIDEIINLLQNTPTDF